MRRLRLFPAITLQVSAPYRNSGMPQLVRNEVVSVIEGSRSRSIQFATVWHEDDHALASPRQQYAICIREIRRPSEIFYVLPTRPAEIVGLPCAGLAPEVCVPTHSDPIKFEALDVELSCDVLKRVGRTHIVLAGKKPDRRVYFRLNKNADGLQADSV